LNQQNQIFIVVTILCQIYKNYTEYVIMLHML